MREYNIQEKVEIRIAVAIGTIKLKEVNQLFETFYVKLLLLYLKVNCSTT